MVPEHVNCNAARQNRKYRSELTLERYSSLRFFSCGMCAVRLAPSLEESRLLLLLYQASGVSIYLEDRAHFVSEKLCRL